MKPVTAEEVKTAAAHAKVTSVDHHACGGCGYMTKFIIEGENIFFDPGCWCSRNGVADLRPTNWYHIAEWINMQSKPANRTRIAEAFGLKLEDKI